MTVESPLDSLSPDQRAVLEMVLGHGRGYDEIARLLSIDRAAVRERAVCALDALEPARRISASVRALMTDYLLGQLPPGSVADVRRRLSQSPSERAWARRVASALEPLASEPLPESPVRVAEAQRPRGVAPARQRATRLAPERPGLLTAVPAPDQRDGDLWRAAATIPDGSLGAALTHRRRATREAETLPYERPPRRSGRRRALYPVVPLTFGAAESSAKTAPTTRRPVSRSSRSRGSLRPGAAISLGAVVLAVLAAILIFSMV